MLFYIKNLSHINIKVEKLVEKNIIIGNIENNKSTDFMRL